MSLIFQPAFLSTCECKKHARIIFSNGSFSEEFFSKEMGLCLASESLDNAKMTTEEFKFLEDSISCLQGMPYLEEDVKLDDIIRVATVEAIVECIRDLNSLKDCPISNQYIN